MTSSYPQSKFETIVDDLFFRVESFNTEPPTSIFLKDNIPFLLERPKGNWIATFDVGGTYNQYIVGHSLELNKHPYFNFETVKCRLDIFTTVRNDTVRGVDRRELSLIFKNSSFANKAYHSLQSILGENCSKVYYPKNNAKALAFENENCENVNNNRVQIELYKDVVANEYIIKINKYINFQFFK